MQYNFKFKMALFFISTVAWLFKIHYITNNLMWFIYITQASSSFKHFDMHRLPMLPHLYNLSPPTCYLYTCV